MAPHPLLLLVLAIDAFFGLVIAALRVGKILQGFLHRHLTAILVIVAAIPACILLYQNRNDAIVDFAVVVFATLGFLQAIDLRSLRFPVLLGMAAAFCVASTITFVYPAREKNPNIDVLLFQQAGADALGHGRNPYSIRVPNIYNGTDSRVFQSPLRFGPGTPFYGPGVVDENGWLTYGFPYPPLSLLLVMPAYWLGGDCRFAHMIATALAAMLMAMARPGRRGALLGLLLLLTAQGSEVIDMSWTEPLLVFTLSLVMFCACRWRAGLPWALGLFFATKQYTVLFVPAIFLLTEGPNPVKEFVKMAAKAGSVVAAVTLPFVAWVPREFFRDVVQWQLVQPFRRDSVSLLPLIYLLIQGDRASEQPPIWASVVAVVPAIWLAIRRFPRSPSGFAAAVTLISLAFFAFNKQAFMNYYYFVIAAGCWSVAALEPRQDALRPSVTATTNAVSVSPVSITLGLDG